MSWATIETEVEVYFDDLPREELKEFAIQEFGLLEDMNADIALEVLADIKKDTAGIGEWDSIKEGLKEILKD